MKFAASMETHRHFGRLPFDLVRAALDFFPARLAEGVLGRLDLELCYVPILMPEKLMAAYPARSRIDRAKRIIFCSLQLDADEWATASVEGRIALYAQGLRECVPLMRRMGASAAEIRAMLGEVDALASHAARQLGGPGA